MTKADVIIVGAGPAGSLAAYELAMAGVSVVILDKEPFPRYKVCGGGLTHKIIGKLPFDVSPVVETSVHNIVFSCGLDAVFRRSSPEPLIYCTGRDRLDQFLLEQAGRAGAVVITGEKVTALYPDPDGVTVQTRDNSYRTSLVIGADGASGIVARAAGLKKDIRPGIAWEAEVTASLDVLEAFRETVFLDWGSFPGGYGWVFPKADHFSIGVGGPASLSKWMIDYYAHFMEYLAKGGSNTGGRTFIPLPIRDTLSMRSWPIPVRQAKGRLHADRIMVAGDAAGLTDSLTGEGIYYAISSGIMAGEAGKQFLEGRISSLALYSDRVNGELMPELLAAGSIKAIFNTVPMRIHIFVRDSDRAWGAFGKILRGERNYADVPRGFGRWRLLWGAARFVSMVVSWLKESGFRKRGFKRGPWAK